MTNTVATTAVIEPESAMPRGWFARVLVAGFALVFIGLVVFSGMGLAHAADGSTALVELTPDNPPYTEQVPADVTIQGYNCKISVVGQATPGDRLTIQENIDPSVPPYVIGHATVTKNGMITDVVVADDSIPSPGRGFMVEVISAGQDDSVRGTTMVAKAFVGNPGGCKVR